MKKNISHAQLRVASLGPAKIPSPLDVPTQIFHHREVLLNPYPVKKWEQQPPSFEISLPSELIYFDPSKATAAIVTCGGICPGLNNVIRSIVHSLSYGYGVNKIHGIKYGLQGFISKYKHPLIPLTPEVVSDIHELGGTILGSSRGEQPIDQVVDLLERQNINILFVIGGDGSLRAAEKIGEEISSRGINICVAAVPKTIDNDISFVHRSFGFETAVDMATQAIKCAHAEAKSFPNGIGLVKLMGRHSGFIAATAAISQRDVNYVLIPEMEFDLEGPKGFLTVLEERLRKKSHAVIVVAEGAGQHFFNHDHDTTDDSGNIQLQDIGKYLQKRINDHFKSKDLPCNLKYIDPSYMVRSVEANTNDGLFCATLGQNAVHAAMAGKTRFVVSNWHGVYCQLPISLAISKPKTIIPGERLWLNVLESTGQPSFTNN